MRRRSKSLWIFAVMAVLLALVFGGTLWWLIRSGNLPVSRRLPDAPAATTIPLPTLSPTGTQPVPATSESARIPSTSDGTPDSTPDSTPTPLLSPSPTPSSTPQPTAIPTRVVSPPEPIALPAGFGISVFAEGLGNPRMMAVGPDGSLYVVERARQRVVRLPDRDGDGIADAVEVVAQGDLEAPSSATFFHDGSLYVGDVRQIVRFSEPDTAGVFQRREVVVDGLPDRQGHSTRTVLFSPDFETLYVSIGSSCNACREQDVRRATIMRYDPDGGAERVVVSGMRNAVGLAIRPGTAELWATNNGRDWLGDDLPPETIYRVSEGDDAGWPFCHAARIIDPDFGAPGACDGVLQPLVEMQAHSAPIGLTFYDGAQFPDAYWGDLFVVFRGSWNRSTPTGYKLVHIPIATDGAPGPVQDFATGWLRANGSNWGRPADVITGSDGSLYLSEDNGGFIYRIFYTGAP